MGQYLVFTLSAALAAMGDLAGNERRGTLTWPGRSAVLGLVAAAQGIRRENTEALVRLDQLKIAVGVITDGAPLRDYHTVETVPTAVAKRPDTRFMALEKAKRQSNTVITLRDYRVGVLYVVALWGAPLEPLAEALKRPVFTLYLGRKSCPLAAPPDPRVAEASDPAEALDQASRPPFIQDQRIIRILSDDQISPEDGVESRNDVATDRVKWHFASRPVYVHRPAKAEASR